MLHGDIEVDSFNEFFADAEPRLKGALTATLGVERGVEAAAEALAYGWEHWERVRVMENPVGYLFRVGQSRAPRFQRTVDLPEVPVGEMPWVEPGLPHALGGLSKNQRVAVLLIQSFGWTYAEVAELLGVSLGTVQTHLNRGMRRLRRALGEHT